MAKRLAVFRTLYIETRVYVKDLLIDMNESEIVDERAVGEYFEERDGFDLSIARLNTKGQFLSNVIPYAEGMERAILGGFTQDLPPQTKVDEFKKPKKFKEPKVLGE